jgi:hypothetical protein
VYLTRIFKTRVCVKCEKRKSIDEFGKAVASGIYKRRECKKCFNYGCAVYRKKNPEKVREGKRIWNKNNSEKIRERKRIWRNNNSEKVKEHSRRWYGNNAEKAKESTKRYCKGNRDNLRPNYVIAVLANRSGLKRSDIKQYPALIAAKREQLRSIRLCKSLQKNKQ